MRLFPPSILLCVVAATAAASKDAGGILSSGGGHKPYRNGASGDGRPRSEDVGYTFDDFVREYGRVYPSEDEYHRRRDIFVKNHETIRNHNEGIDSRHRSNYTLGVNQFADMILDEELPTGLDKASHPAYWTGSRVTNYNYNINNNYHNDKGNPSGPLFPPMSSWKVPLPWQPDQWEPQHTTALDGRRLRRNQHGQDPRNQGAVGSGDDQGTTLRRPDRATLPPSVDWRTGRSRGGDGPIVGVTTPVKNQGGCGSCWAFAATAALESHVAIQTGTLFVLSVQELVSCVPNIRECGGEGGCTGSTAELAFDFVAQHGVVDEWTFGYQSYRGAKVNCTIMAPDANDGGAFASPPPAPGATTNVIRGAVASIVGFANLPTNSYDNLMAAVATMGPVVINVAATGWGLYKGGIFDDDKEPHRDLNHAVVLEGYGTDEETGQDYWLVRNSWGPLWGEDGYIRLKRVNPATLADPKADCKMDVKPADGVACKKDEGGNDVVPPAVEVCGTSGILFDGVVPVGGHLLR